MFTCWQPDGSVGLVSGYRHRPAPARRRLVLGGARPPRRAAAARRRVGRAGPRRPAARQGPRAVGRARVRRADGAVDGRPTRRTPPRSTIPTTRSAGPTACRRRWRSTSSGTPTGRRRRCRATATRRTASCTASSSCAGGPLHLAEVAGPALAPLGRPRSAPLDVPDAYAHTGLRAPFAFPDGTVADWVLTPDGWRSRARAPAR